MGNTLTKVADIKNKNIYLFFMWRRRRAGKIDFYIKLYFYIKL